MLPTRRKFTTPIAGKVEFVVTFSSLAWRSIQNKCTDKTICGTLSPVYYLGLSGDLINKALTEYQAATTQETNLAEKPEPMCVLMNPYSANAACELCLKESSGSETIGESLLSTSIHPAKILIVLYPTNTDSNFREMCRLNGACSMSEDKVLPSTECRRLIREPSAARGMPHTPTRTELKKEPSDNHKPIMGSFREIDDMQHTPTRTELKIEPSENHKPIMGSFREIDDTPRCLSIRSRNGVLISKCIDSITKLTNGEVLWLQEISGF
uniref:AlNc14C282G10134 protein n=1 Tax=Albugo laibachii Nc14 TaxID=890382 RepID=F0WUY7_9STRA|nr:AlNc14C282G10134 [Albugo laibachii Nc14]|eukprot:CCA25223.1 AlNc14C282G10134 [Albugo laibachii Nc14]